MAVSAWFMIFTLVLLIGLIGLIVAFVRGGSTTRWVIGGLCTIVFLLAMFASLYSVRRVDSAQPATVVSSETHGTWRHAGEYLLDSDVYPSARSAAKGLAADIAPLLGSVAPAGQKPDRIIVSTTEKVHRTIGDAAAEVLRARAPGVVVNVEPADDDIGTLHLKLDLGGTFQSSIEGVVQHSGRTLQAELRGPAGTLERVARFVDKPWVDEFDEFISEQPDGTYLLAQSPSPAVHPGEALSMAKMDACNQLVEHVINRTGRHDAGHFNTVQNAILAELNQGRFIHDRFVREFNRPGGTVYQASLLIKPDAVVLDQIAAHQYRAQAVARSRQYSSIFAGLAMLAVVCVLYAFLNMATKGYYAASLRVVAAVVVVGGVVLLWLMAATDSPGAATRLPPPRQSVSTPVPAP